MTHFDQATFDETLTSAVQQLLNSRVKAGYWEGELASSALATATAVFALALYHSAHSRLQVRQSDERAGTDLRATCQRLIKKGVEWLVKSQNPDGGWGDTVLSQSNISTTALCWAAVAHVDETFDADGSLKHDMGSARAAAESWLVCSAGSLEPETLARAIVEGYGVDRTFSAPILTMCTLAGRMGSGGDAWHQVPQLPFELAACPHRWFKWVHLPVVSYALPALIAIGQVRHDYLPTRNPIMRLVRCLIRQRTLRILSEIQPANGGFLEAVPLTGFVVMSLVAIGQVEHPVASHGVDFLIRSARDNGSWPIDTNLATWLTTLSVNAFSISENFTEFLTAAERRAIRDWLLMQQYRREHPYTHAEPGGWAWTDLPGGVPDADDTAGALLALRNLGFMDEEVIDAACAGVRWLLSLQNRDGGMPTFCRGWSALPFDRSGPDLTAHALLAWAKWHDDLPQDLTACLKRAIERGVDYLMASQRPDGAWVPLWFGNQAAQQNENPTFGTARVLLALNVLSHDRYERHGLASSVSQMKARGVRWLLAAQSEDGGWGGEEGVPASIEETGLAVQALAGAKRDVLSPGDSPNRQVHQNLEADGDAIRTAISHGVCWLVEHTDGGQRFDPSPIGLYFAKLWYFERQYPLIFTVAALMHAESALSAGFA